MRVLKYSLPPVGYVGLGMHGDPKPLALGWQGRQLVMWAEVDETQPVRIHPFEVVVTGGAVPDGGNYVGSSTLLDGEPHVVHV